MTKIAGIDIAGTIAEAFDGLLLPVVLTREVQGEYNPVEDRYEDENGNPVEPGEQEFTTEGIVEAFSEMMLANSQIESNDRKITLLGKPLNTVPDTGDSLEIEDQEFTVVSIIGRDPAAATYTVQGRL